MVVLDTSIVVFGGADERKNLSNDLFVINGSKYPIVAYQVLLDGF
jgi:hypothetical protein